MRPNTTHLYSLLCVVIFPYAGYYYLVLVDRLANWPVAEKAADCAKGLEELFGCIFITYGINDQLTSALGNAYGSAKLDVSHS